MRKLSLSLALLLAFSVNAIHAEPKELKPNQTWSGTHNESDLKKLAPKTGFVRNKTQWKKLWSAWKGEEKVPEINFRKYYVVVSTINGPNKMFASFKLDDKGDLKVVAGGTKKGGPGFGYHLAQVPRKGVKTINGVSVRLSKPKPKPKP